MNGFGIIAATTAGTAILTQCTTPWPWLTRRGPRTAPDGGAPEEGRGGRGRGPGQPPTPTGPVIDWDWKPAPALESGEPVTDMTILDPLEAMFQAPAHPAHRRDTPATRP